MGEGEPAPIQEDVPEEFFDADALVQVGLVYWKCNWEVALENSMDSHVNYVHRNARGGHARRLHRPRRPGRAPHLRGQRLRRRRGRGELHAQEPGLRPLPERLAVAQDELSPLLDLADPAARRSRAAQYPAAEVGALVRRPSPARHVPRGVRLGPLHAHVRAGGGAPHAGVVLPLHAAEERVAPLLGPGGLRHRAALDHRVQLLAPGRAGDAATSATTRRRSSRAPTPRSSRGAGWW